MPGLVSKDDPKSHPKKWEGEHRRYKCVKQKNAVSVVRDSVLTDHLR